MPFPRPLKSLRSMLTAIGSLSAMAWSSAAVSVQTQKLAESGNFVSVNAVVRNTGTDTLRNLRYVWTMDWSDHGAGVVPELDWSSVSGVVKTVVLRSDYLAEVSYSMPGAELLPGASLQLNTRIHLSDWSSFNCKNDWSYLGLKAGLAENGNVSVYSDSVKLWGAVAERVDPTPVNPKIEVTTRKMQESPNTLGLEFKVKNTGNVPVTHAVATWIGQPHEGQMQPVVDWTDAPALKVNVQDPLEERSYVHLDLDTTVVAVGAVKTIQMRLTVPDGQVDWSKDWSYAGISSAMANGLIGAQVVGYPTTGTVVSRDTVVDGVGIKDGFVTDTSNAHLVSYDLSALPGYATRTGVPVTVQAGSIVGWAPFYKVVDESSVPAPVFEGALRVGRILDIHGKVEAGHKLTVAVPIPDGIAAGKVAHLQVVHYVDGAWKRETIDSVANGAAYVQVASFSNFATGVTQVTQTLAAGSNHGLWIDKAGRPWALGKNDKGQLGTGNSSDALSAIVPVYWPRTTKVVAVAAGLWHSLLLDEEGNVWAFGDNGHGQCGQADLTQSVLKPVKVLDAAADPDRAILTIAAGDTTSYAVNVKGNVFAWGANSRLQLGRRRIETLRLGMPISYDEPFSAIPEKAFNYYAQTDLEGIRYIAAGSAHVFGYDAKSSMAWTWGTNRSRQQTSAYDEFNTRPRKLILDLAHYGADTLRVGGCAAAGVGCWSHQIIMPWYNAPDQVFAGGDMSGMKLWDRRTAGNRALNLVWGDNSLGQIQTGGPAAIDTPMNVSQYADGQISLGANHLLESWHLGYGTDAVGNVVQFYPVRARGGNEKGQAVPSLAATTVSSWSEVKAATGGSLHCAALAAGAGLSLSYDNATEIVYAWGGPWGASVKAVPKGSSAFLEVLWPLPGDTIPSAGIKPQVREWTNGLPLTYWANSVSCPSGNASCNLLVKSNSGLLAAIVPVVVKDRGGVEFPSDEIFDVTKNQSLHLKVTLPQPAKAIWFQFSALNNPKKILYMTGVSGNFSSGENVVNFDGSATADPYDSMVHPGHIGDKLTTGSYFVQMIYRPVWGTVDDDQRIPVTIVDSEEVFRGSVRRSFHGAQWGGPDSFEVDIPRAGLIQAHASNYNGKLLDGSWDLLSKGMQRIEFLNIDPSGNLGVGLDSVLQIYWAFRGVSNALRVRGETCGSWEGYSSNNIDAFDSQIGELYYSGFEECNDYYGKWVFGNFTSNAVIESGDFETGIRASGVGVISVARNINFSVKRYLFVAK